MVTNEETDSAVVPHSRPRFQFSLGALMLLVTAVSVLCALTAWLGTLLVVFPVLAISPLAAAIFVRIRGSEQAWSITLCSGLISMVLWEGVAIGGGILTALDSGHVAVEMLVIGMGVAVCIAPAAFFVGIVTGVAWEVGAYVLKKCWHTISLRQGLGPAEDGGQ
jgi:hypothetical protein